MARLPMQGQIKGGLKKTKLQAPYKVYAPQNRALILPNVILKNYGNEGLPELSSG